LYLVADQEDAVAIAQRAQLAEIARGRDDVAAFPLDRLDEDRRDAVRRYVLGEQLPLDPRHAAHRARRLAATVFAAIAIAVGNVIDLRKERPESAALDGFAGSEAQTAIRAAVKRAQKGDDRWTAGRMSHQLDGAFDGFRP
jgi:ParB family chromosome partitioning protein